MKLQELQFAIDRALDQVSANKNYIRTINISFKLLDLINSCCLNEYDIQIKCEENILYNLLIAISKTDSKYLDLFACLFAYFSIFKCFHSLCSRFICTLQKDENVANLLQELYQNNQPIIDDDYAPGFYTIASHLSNFEKIDEALLNYLNLNLSSILMKYWIPSWKNFKNLELYNWILESELISWINNEAKLDFVICIKNSYIYEWEQLQSHNVNSIEYFLYKISLRTLKFRFWIPQTFYTFCLKFNSRCIDRLIFLEIYSDNKIRFQVLMEILDHPTLNILDEPHLILLLRVSLDNIRQICQNDENGIPSLHKNLGELGTTQSFPSLINMLQFIIARFLITIGNVIQCGYEDYSDDKRIYQPTIYRLPTQFNSLIPEIPPISKSLFGFYNNKVEPLQETTNFTRLFTTLLECLALILHINEIILEFYYTQELNSLNHVNLAENNNKLHVYETDDINTSIKNRVVMEYLQMFYISSFSSLLLSEQLSEIDTPYSKFLSKNFCQLMSKIVFRHSLKCFEKLLNTYDNSALYYLLKFISLISIEDLVFQKLSIRLLNHLFFHGNSDRILQMCLKNELSIQTLLEYVSLWNDGSDQYTSFFQKVFKINQPYITTVTKKYADLIEFLPNHKFYESVSSASELKFELLQSPKKMMSTNISSKPKFNANATSFIPASKTRSISVSSNSPQPLEQCMPQLQQQSYQPSQIYTINNSITCGNNSSMMVQPILSEPYGSLAFVPQNTTTQSTSRTGSINLINSNNTWATPAFSNEKLSFSNRVVNTGKNYILGGHNRIVNNSRSQSIHVDEFEKQT